MVFLEKIKYHKEQQHCIRVQMERDEFKGNSFGYILDYSDQFLLLQQMDAFRLSGYLVVPMNTVAGIFFDDKAAYYDKVMRLEQEFDRVGIGYDVHLESWETLFKSIKKNRHSVIIECEATKDELFTIGPIKRITNSAVYVQYIDTSLYYHMPFDKMEYDDITRVMFQKRFVEVASKYARVK